MVAAEEEEEGRVIRRAMEEEVEAVAVMVATVMAAGADGVRQDTI